MNIALPALITLLLFLPGPIFVYTYKGSLRNPKAPMVSTAAMNAGWVISGLAAIGIHSVWIIIVAAVSAYRVDLNSVLYLVSGHYDDAESFKRILNQLVDSHVEIAAYLLLTSFSAAAAGFGLHYIIRHFNIDRRVGFLRFNNGWHYLLSNPEDEDRDPWVTVTVGHSDHTCMYAGLLESYAQTADGQLERIVLCDPIFRLELKNPPCEDFEYCSIVSDRLVIWCRDVNTLNIEYFSAVEEGTSGALANLDIPENAA